ncbi:uncharacterized protein LOC122840143 isoform X3 [Gambusia affinis]|uniref:uncharacterized protein LOC122840143 isoform X3 n=1 Tax=Gambusia affinis TaxID=33528 RepID=UPI001CDCDDE7|nr:uncharacterized protein LOC122840143 isoform X3 [Gambusia affinis]
MGGFNIELSINIPKKREQAVETSSATANSLDGTQSQNRNCDNELMEQDDGDDSSSEKSTGSTTNEPSTMSRLRDSFFNWTESRNSSSRKPEQSNQTTDSKGWSFPSRFKLQTPVLKVHCTATSDTFGADTDIMKQLKNNLKSSVQLEETTRKNCSIIILFCPVSRSFESEVKFAMEKEAVSSSGKQFILVLMHHTRDPDYSTAGCDTSEVLKNVFYVHVFYHETENGLLKLAQNAQAIKAIEDVILHKK